MTPHLTVAEQLEILKPGLSERKKPLLWPPDMFAVCASLLSLSGGYCVAARDWPPRKRWAENAESVGLKWRKMFQTSVPPAVQKLWTTILSFRNSPISDLQQNRKVCVALIELLAIADEASMGAGVPVDAAWSDNFDEEGDLRLAVSNDAGAANLCKEICESVARVLPKMRVPQNGLTLRSFSHHLAFVAGAEIRPYWHTIAHGPFEADSLDLLVLPWPRQIDGKSFKRVKPTEATMKNLPKSFGFFKFDHKNGENLAQEVLRFVQLAASHSETTIDAVVMPELALSEEEYDQISTMLFSKGIYLIAGVVGKETRDGTTPNCVKISVPLVNHNIRVHQPKHHRWKLDKNQISTYGLSLPKTMQFWEHIPIGDRSLTFICLRDWLAFCVLICEDLARPDPVADVLRAVGPNLVIALLLDGPQLGGRWSGRYATALADDPGCSVLTLTSAGMTSLSKPPTMSAKKSRKSLGKVALWKDMRGHTFEIDIKSGDAALLHIEVVEKNDWTADGRPSHGASGYPLLKSVKIFKGNRKVREYDVKAP
jgi:hypothetical protein